MTSKWCDFQYLRPVIFAMSPRSRNIGQANKTGFTVTDPELCAFIAIMYTVKTD